MMPDFCRTRPRPSAARAEVGPLPSPGRAPNPRPLVVSVAFVLTASVRRCQALPTTIVISPDRRRLVIGAERAIRSASPKCFPRSAGRGRCPPGLGKVFRQAFVSANPASTRSANPSSAPQATQRHFHLVLLAQASSRPGPKSAPGKRTHPGHHANHSPSRPRSRQSHSRSCAKRSARNTAVARSPARTVVSAGVVGPPRQTRLRVGPWPDAPHDRLARSRPH